MASDLDARRGMRFRAWNALEELDHGAESSMSSFLKSRQKGDVQYFIIRQHEEKYFFWVIFLKKRGNLFPMHFQTSLQIAIFKSDAGLDFKQPKLRFERKNDQKKENKGDEQRR